MTEELAAQLEVIRERLGLPKVGESRATIKNLNGSTQRGALEGERIGSWTVLEYRGGKRLDYLCECDCGKQAVKRAAVIKKWKPESCCIDCYLERFKGKP